MQMKLIIQTFVFPAALVACTTTGIAADPKEKPVAIGQRAQAGGLIVTPLKLLEDSRCPANARCMWAGRVLIRARIKGGSWTKVRDLELSKPLQIADGALTLTDVTPVKIVPNKLKQKHYRFSFNFDGGL